MVTKRKSQFLRRWRIVEMEQWHREYMDFVVPGYIEFSSIPWPADLTVVWKLSTGNSESSSLGREKTTTILDAGEAGRRFAMVSFFGRLYIHCGDDSWFKARRM
jgi:hypothetical protein